MISLPCPLANQGTGQMARTVARLPAGSRITDHISLAVIAKTFPVSKIHAVLAATGTASVRQRDLPAHVVVYYVIAPALYMQSSYREVLRCLLEGVHQGVHARLRGLCGFSTRRRPSRWRASRAFRKRARGSDGNRCANCMTRWCGRSRFARRAGPGIGDGVWSAWMAARWTLPTRRQTTRPSA